MFQLSVQPVLLGQDIVVSINTAVKVKDDAEQFTPLVELKDIEDGIAREEAKYNYSAVAYLKTFKQITELLTKPEKSAITKDELLSLAGKLQVLPGSNWIKITVELQYKPDSQETKDFLKSLYTEMHGYLGEVSPLTKG